MSDNPTLRLLLERSSVRNYEDRPVEPDVMEELLRAAIQAPTGGNLQPYSIVQVENPETRKKLATFSGGQKYVAEAPVNLVFCMDFRRLKRWALIEDAPYTHHQSFRAFWIAFQDTLCCAQSACVAADALGLGTVYIGTILEYVPDIRELLDLPSAVFPVVLLCVGYPKNRPKPSNRLGSDTVVHREKYRDIGDEELRHAFAAKYDGPNLPASEPRREEIAQVCRTVHGEDFARRCLDRVEEQGFINRAQHYFGLHYRADKLPMMNEAFVKWTREAGCNWFGAFEKEER
jgi:FMN reductase [NAD(P)H]